MIYKSIKSYLFFVDLLSFISRLPYNNHYTPYGIRTRVSDVKRQRPNP